MEKTINPRNNYNYITTDKLEVFIISKPFDYECQEEFLKVVLYLQNNGVSIYSNQIGLDYAVKDTFIERYKDKTLIDKVDFKAIQVFVHEESKINRVITLGGDGTILYAIKMFYNVKVPPIISFGLGSVGYL